MSADPASDYDDPFGDPDPPTRPRLRAAPNPSQVDGDINRYLDEMEDAQADYKALCRRAAESEADYKDAYHTSLVENANAKPAALRESMAYLSARQEFRAWKLVEQAQKASQAYLVYLRTRIEALRTIAANYRALG